MPVSPTDAAKLTNLIRGQVSADESAALCARVASEPDLARAYADLKLRLDRQVGRGFNSDSAQGENGTATLSAASAPAAAPDSLLLWVGLFLLAGLAGALVAILLGPGFSAAFRG